MCANDYLMSIKVLNILGFICVMVSEVNWHSRANWFNFCAMGGFWITGILLAFYLFHVIEKLYFIPWIMVVSSSHLLHFDEVLITSNVRHNRRWRTVACGVSSC